MEYAVGRSFLPPISLISQIRVYSYVTVSYLEVNCAYFEFVPRFSPIYIIYTFVLHRISPFCSPSPVLKLVTNDGFQHLKMSVDEYSILKITNTVCDDLNKSVDGHSLPEITNDVSDHLRTSVDEHFWPMLIIREWLMQGPVLA